MFILLCYVVITVKGKYIIFAQCQSQAREYFNQCLEDEIIGIEEIDYNAIYRLS